MTRVCAPEVRRSMADWARSASLIIYSEHPARSKFCASPTTCGSASPTTKPSEIYDPPRLNSKYRGATASAAAPRHGNASAATSVKGHWNLPRGGRETCPLKVTRVACSSGAWKRWAPQAIRTVACRRPVDPGQAAARRQGGRSSATACLASSL